MLTLVLVVVGPLTCAWLIAAGRRAAVADRVRSLGPRSRWRVPERLRTRLVDALRDADLAWTPEEAVGYWGIARGRGGVARRRGGTAPRVCLRCSRSGWRDR